MVLGPDEGGASNWGWVLGNAGLGFAINHNGGVSWWGLVLVDELLVWEVIDSDTLLGTNYEPVDLGGEEDNVNWGLSIDFLEMSSLNEVPDVDLTVSTTGGDEVGIWCEVKSVDLGLVSNEGVHEGHDGVIPNLDGLIPRGRDDDWGLDIVEVSNAGDPVGMWVLVNGELADTVDVPDLDGLVNGSRGNLSVVWGEGNGEDVLGVTDEGLSGGGGLQVPESDGTIPGGREAESRVLGEIDIRDEMGVSSHDLSGLSPLLLLIGVGGLIEIPDNEGLISGSRDKELSVVILGDFFFSDLHGGDPAVVSLEETFVRKLVALSFRHLDKK